MDPKLPNHVCRLIKSLYGLKQAPRPRNFKFTSYLPSFEFCASLSDTSLFVKQDDKDIILFLLYVDDIILTGSNTMKIQFVIDNLDVVFDLKNMGQTFLLTRIAYSIS